MNDRALDADSLVILKRLVAEVGTPQLLRLIADVAQQHANELLGHGASLQAGRLAREASILAKAADAILD